MTASVPDGHGPGKSGMTIAGTVQRDNVQAANSVPDRSSNVPPPTGIVSSTADINLAHGWHSHSSETRYQGSVQSPTHTHSTACILCVTAVI